MNLVLTAEQEQLRDTVRRFLADVAPVAAVRRIAATATGFDPVLWRRMVDLGLPVLAVPVARGGAGGGYVELAVVAEELGRALTPAPFLATAGLALPALLAAGDVPDLVERVAGGGAAATLAWMGDDGDWDGAPDAVAASAGADGWRLDGHRSYVLDGQVADLLVVTASTPDGLGLFAVEAGAPGLERVALPTLDQTRRLARLTFAAVAARRIGLAADAAAVLVDAVDHATVLLAAEMVGGARACLAASVAYAKEREQFGRPIGSFQAVKHKCADMVVRIEAAAAAATYGGFAAMQSPDELPTVAALAKAEAGDAYLLAAGENVQIHGGIGFTWEHDAHLYLKRAKSADLFLGTAGLQRRRLADRIGL